jgi:hypothetical protein
LLAFAIINGVREPNPINGPDARRDGQFNAASSHGTIQVPEPHTGASTATDDESQDSSVASHQFMTPSSTACRTSRVGHHHSAGRSVQSTSLVAVPRNRSPSFNHSSHTPQNFDFDAQLSLLHPSSYQFSNNQAQLPPQCTPWKESSQFTPNEASVCDGHDYKDG